jgi:hypothetical protein
MGFEIHNVEWGEGWDLKSWLRLPPIPRYREDIAVAVPGWAGRHHGEIARWKPRWERAYKRSSDYISDHQLINALRNQHTIQPSRTTPNEDIRQVWAPDKNIRQVSACTGLAVHGSPVPFHAYAPPARSWPDRENIVYLIAIHTVGYHGEGRSWKAFGLEYKVVAGVVASTHFKHTNRPNIGLIAAIERFEKEQRQP